MIEMRKEVRTLMLVLMAFMIMTTAMIKVIEYAAGNQPTLSLRGVAPPTGEVIFTTESSPYARYLRSSVGIKYDGKDWDLQGIGEVRDYLHKGMKKDKALSFEPEYLSRLYGDFNRDMLNTFTVINDPECLELPDNITERTRDLSRRITEGMPTPFEKAKAIETFLRVKYQYQLDYPPAPLGQEPNDWFLFDTKTGICGNFNSAFVILARASGIPARLATGYYLLPGAGESQPVYSSQAHAWSEVGFAETGWLVFEATPP